MYYRSFLSKTMHSCLVFLLFQNFSFAENHNPPQPNSSGITEDSLNKAVAANEVKHYIKSALFLNTFTTPDRKVKNDQLLSYRFSEISAGFNVPLKTITRWHEDEKRYSTTHVLLSGTYAVSTIDAYFTPEVKTLDRLGIGFKFIHNDGNKNSFFLAINPYSAGQKSLGLRNASRLSTLFIYNRTVNEKFSFRLGVWKNYLSGSSRTLPIIGARFGRYERVNFSIEFPRSLSLNVPVKTWFNFSLFSRVQGTVYNFKNEDPNFFNRPAQISLGRRDVLTGIQSNFRFGPVCSMFFSFGTSTGEVTRADKIDRRAILKRNRYEFSKQELMRAPFVMAGINFYFGKTKNVQGNVQLYDVIDMNNLYGMDDGNATLIDRGLQGGKDLELKNLQYRDIADLIDEQDIY